MELTIRDATEGELEEIYEMGQPDFQDPDRYDWGWELPYLRMLLNPSFGMLHVAVHAGRIVGFHGGVWRYPESSDTQCRMYWLYTVADYRGQGVSLALIRRSIEEARRIGKRSMCVGIWDYDEVARDRVTSLGFAPAVSLVIHRLEL